MSRTYSISMNLMSNVSENLRWVTRRIRDELGNMATRSPALKATFEKASIRWSSPRDQSDNRKAKSSPALSASLAQVTVHRSRLRNFPKKSRRLFTNPKSVNYRLVLAATITGIITDVSKLICFNWLRPYKWEQEGHDWKHIRWFLFTNLFGCLVAIIASKMLSRRPLALPLILGLIFVGVGWLDELIEHTAMIPVAWHGAIGFTVALTLFVRRQFEAITKQWRNIDAKDPIQALEIKKQLMQEMQWSLTTFTTIWLTLTAIFGVAMTIAFQTPPKGEEDDAKWNAFVMALSFSGCLLTSCSFAAAYAIKCLFRVRSRWRSTN